MNTSSSLLLLDLVLCEENRNDSVSLSSRAAVWEALKEHFQNLMFKLIIINLIRIKMFSPLILILSSLEDERTHILAENFLEFLKIAPSFLEFLRSGKHCFENSVFQLPPL